MTSRRWGPGLPDPGLQRTAGTPGAALRSVRFEIVVGLPDLIHFFKPHGTENDGEQFQRGVALRLGHLLKADATSRHETGRKVGPILPLLVVVKSINHVLPLIGIERGKEVFRRIHDARRPCCLLSDSLQRQHDEDYRDDRQQVSHFAPVNFTP